MMLKLITTKVLLMLFAEHCLLQEVPGLAYMDILRTAPRKRIEGAAPDPALPDVPLQPEINRRYDVMLDYDYDYLDGDDSEEFQLKPSSVATTLERPQNTEALLSTDVSDYVLFNIDSREEVDAELAKLPSVTLTYGQDFLPTDSHISQSSVSQMKLPVVETVKQNREQASQESTQYLTAVRVPSYSEEFLNDGHTFGPQMSQVSPANVGNPYDDFTGSGYYPVLNNPSGVYPQYSYSGDYPVSFLSDEDPSNPDYYHPTTVYDYEDTMTTILPSGSYSAENFTRTDDLVAIVATSSQNYPSYSPNEYHLSDSASRERSRALFGTSSRSKNYGRRLNYKPPTSNFATRVGKQISSPVRSKNVPSRLDKQNREEIMYYTGLQKEIEKSSLLLDAIRDVRTREGKAIDKVNTKPTTTTVSPPPSISSIKSTFGSHPLYRNLPGVSDEVGVTIRSIAQREYDDEKDEYENRYLPARAKSIAQREYDNEKHEYENMYLPVRAKSIAQREYDNEKDEYENMYLPARAKSLELSEIDEVREHFNTLVPKSAYRSSDFPKYPSYPGQLLYMPPVTTYKPSQIPKYNKKLKPPTLSPAKLPVEHRSKPSQKYPSSSFISKPQKSYTPQLYRPSGGQHTSKPYSSSSKSINPYTLDRSTRSYHVISPPATKTYNNVHKYIPVSSLGYRTVTTRPYYRARDTTSTQLSTPDQSKPVTRHNSRQPSETLYEDAGRPHRPNTEDPVRHKRGRNMEFTIDSKVRFPKFGYNIDRYFDDFPAFGFFDYDPSREIY